MVVASTLAFLAVNNKLGGLTKGQLVEMAMENEKRVGAFSNHCSTYYVAPLTSIKCGRCKQWRVRILSAPS